MANAGELLDRWVQMFNEARWDEAEALYASDGILQEVGTGRTANAGETTAIGKEWRTAFPDARGTIQTRVASGNRAVAEIVWTGTHRGPLSGLPPTNRPVQVLAVAVLEEKNGRIGLIRHYIDVAGLFGQLETSAGAPAEVEVRRRREQGGEGRTRS